jgi:purine-cytosine permease-like protein
LAWSPAACDFYVYFPPTAKRWKVFMSVLVGLSLGSIFPVLIGIGLGSGTLVYDDWSAAAETSTGSLLRVALSPLGRFGDFCCVLLALGLISNNVPGIYSSALSFQLLGRWFASIPRVIWVFVSIISNFLPLMGYWTLMWIAMTFEDEFLFRRKRGGYNWDDWNTPSALPIGIAALVSFCIGWVSNSAVDPDYVFVFGLPCLAGWRSSLHVAGLLYRSHRRHGGRWY